MQATGEMTKPSQAGDLQKGDYICMGTKNRPCRIIENSIIKNGKHGHAKAVITSIDIFNGQRFEDQYPASHVVQCPIVELKTNIMTAYDDTHIQTMNENGESEEFLRPEWPERYDEQLCQLFNDANKNNVNFNLNIQSAMGMSQIISHKVDKN